MNVEQMNAAERAMSGPHAGWDTFDIGNEGLRMQALHDTLAAVPFDGARARTLLAELEAFAEGVGYADADSCLEMIASTPDPRLAADMRELVFERHGEGDYFAQVSKSERAMGADAATDDARRFLGMSGTQAHGGILTSAMLAAYESGRDMCAAQRAAATGTSRPKF